MLSTLEKRLLFSKLLAELLLHSIGLGYLVAVAEVQRGTQQAEWNAEHCAKCKQVLRNHTAEHKFKAIGLRNSLHIDGLAVDLLLYKRDSTERLRYLTDTRDYQVLGEWWEKLDGQCCWGGRFGDGGHFSITHGGRK